MSEKRGRGQPKFEPTPDQRSQVKQMKALGIPEDRICKTITNPRTRKPVAPMTLVRAFAAELESGATEFHPLAELDGADGYVVWSQPANAPRQGGAAAPSAHRRAR